MKIRKAKKETKILKEISREVKEVKKEKNGNSEQEEENLDNDFSSNGEFSGAGNRTAPVLQASGETQSLERVAEAAPRNTNNENNEAKQDFYTANYNSKYDGSRYETRVTDNRPAIRSAGVLQEQPRADFSEIRRLQRMEGGTQTQHPWEANQPRFEEQKYRPSEETHRRLPFERKKKMM